MENCQVCVIGVGELGSRIAGELSLHGLKVNVFDSDLRKVNRIHQTINNQREELVKNGLISSDCHMDVTISQNLAAAVENADFIFESVIDQLDVKQWLYEKMTHNCKSDTVICSNTLSLSIEDISSLSLFKERIIGCRFLMPVYRIPLVELTYTKNLSPNTLQKVKDLFNHLNKNVIVRRPGDSPRRLTIQETTRYWKDAKTLEKSNQNRYNRKGIDEQELFELIVIDKPIKFDDNNTSGHGRNDGISVDERKNNRTVPEYHQNDKTRLNEDHHGVISGHGRDVLSDIKRQEFVTTSHAFPNLHNDVKRHHAIDEFLIDNAQDHHGVSGHGRNDLSDIKRQELTPSHFAPTVYNIRRHDIIDGILTDSTENHHGVNSGHGRDELLKTKHIGAKKSQLQRHDIIDGILTDYSDDHHGDNRGHGRDDVRHITRDELMSLNISREKPRGVAEKNNRDEVIASVIQTEQRNYDYHNGEPTKQISTPKPKSEHTACSGMIRHECVVCQDALVNAVLDPCGHMWLCFHCANTVKNSQQGCPACRCAIEKVLRVYLP